MSKTKFGFSQTEQPAPLWYRRLSNALIMALVPGLTVLIQSWGMKDLYANRWLAGLTFLPMLIKAVGMLLGNGQSYVPSNETIDEQNESK